MIPYFSAICPQQYSSSFMWMVIDILYLSYSLIILVFLRYSLFNEFWNSVHASLR